jgi:hypothetical protein
MRRQRWGAALAAALVAACLSCSSTSGPAPAASSSADRVCADGVCLSLDRFTESVTKRLNGRVVGSIVTVGPDRVVSSGYARTSIDPLQTAMSPSVLVNVASVGKMFTTIAVLKTLTAHHLSTDSRIGPFLPSTWARGPGVDTITFQDLLTHQAGFRQDSDGIFTDENAARAQIAAGIDVSDKATPDYNNLNFSIFRDLLPRMTAVSAPPSTRAASDRAFISDIQRLVFSPADVTDATCSPSRAGLLMYPTLTSLSGQDHGSLPLAHDPPGACSPGGWTMSVASMRQIMIELQNGILLTSAERAQLDAGCLGWDCSIIKQAHYRAKSGDLDDGGSAALHTYSGLLLGTVPFVIVTNSDASDTLIDIVDSAMTAAVTS